MIGMQDYTTPTPDPARLQGLVLAPWHSSTVLQHARGTCCSLDEKTWLDVEAGYGHRKPATTVKGSGEPRSGLHLRGEHAGSILLSLTPACSAEQSPSWPRPSSGFGTLTR